MLGEPTFKIQGYEKGNESPLDNLDNLPSPFPRTGQSIH